MPRIRSIKPEFFLHEGLAELPAYQRLAFIGLWTLADRDGRLEDRPKRIKAALFPYEDVDPELFLCGLHSAGFIQRYAVGEGRYICIPGFSKHQKPHPKESSFNLPPPPSREISGQAVEENGKPGKGDDEQGGCLSMVNGSGKEKASDKSDARLVPFRDIWDRVWKATHFDEAPDFDASHISALKKFLKAHPEVTAEEFERRVRFSMADTWFVQHGSLRAFCPKWSNWTQAAVRNPSTEVGDFSNVPIGRVEL